MLGEGSAAMVMGPVVKDSVAEVEDSTAVEKTVVGSTTVAGSIMPSVAELERVSDTL